MHGQPQLKCSNKIHSSKKKLIILQLGKHIIEAMGKNKHNENESFTILIIFCH